MPRRGKDDPRYELVDMGSCSVWMATNERAEELRALVKEHMVNLDEGLGWKGPVEAVVPRDIAPDVAEAMDFVGAIVDTQTVAGDNKVRLYSQGYYVHIGA